MNFLKDKKGLKNFSAGLLVKLATLLSQLLLVPIFLKTLGVQTYGEWLIITAIPNYLLLSDLGLTVTITNEICRLNTLNDTEKANALFKSTNSLLLLIGTILIFSFLVFAFFFNIADLLKLKFINEIQTEAIILIYLINIVCTLLFNFNLGQFKAENKFYKYEFFNSILFYADFLITAAILILKLELYFIPLALIVNRVIMFFIVKKNLSRFEHYSYGFSGKLGLAKKMIPTSLSYTMFTLGYAFFLQGNTFLIGIKLGSSQVVVFNTVRTLVNSIKAFVGILYLPTMPEFTILITKGQVKEALLKLKRIIVIVFAGAIFLASGVYLFQHLIFKVWVGSKFNYSQVFLITMLVSIIFQTLWNAESMVPMSVNRNKQLALFPILGLVNLVIQYFILNTYGLTGASVALLLMDITLFIYLFFVAKRIITS
jgi:O-antigen/teichoic acid export membrane protein